MARSIREVLKEEGIRSIYIDVDESMYFQYGRSYRAIDEHMVERLDHRVVIITLEKDIEVLFRPLDSDYWQWEQRVFKTLTEALKWIEREVK